MKKTQHSFTLSIEFDLTTDELWPDGDAPENPTVEDVQNLIDKCGGAEKIIRDWNLIGYRDKFHIFRN